MESFLNRYRNITVLLLVLFAQLVLLAVQVKNASDVRLIRVWAVSAVTPAARVIEWFRGGSIGLVRNYILMHDASQENRGLHQEVGRLRLENNYLRNELATADRAKALQLFQASTPSKMVAANVIGTGAGSNSKVVFVSRGSAEGVMRGMAVVTPDGIVGQVIAAYPTASEVLLVTDPDFAAGVITQKGQARGTLKGQGTPLCKVDYVPAGEKVQPGEMFYTSGDDRIFPRGFMVGIVKAVRPGQPFQEILVEPSGLQHGLEDVLIILDAVHQAIPESPPANQPVYLAPAPPESHPVASAGASPAVGSQAAPAGTEADKLRAVYQSVGEAQGHNFGTGPPGSKPPDFTHLPGSPLPPPAPKASAPGPAPAANPPAPTKPSEPRPAAAKPPAPVNAPEPRPAAAKPPAPTNPPEPRPAAAKPPAPSSPSEPRPASVKPAAPLPAAPAPPPAPSAPPQ